MQEDEGSDPIPVTLGEVVGLLNRQGISIEEARRRPRWELEAVLGLAIAPALAARRELRDQRQEQLPGHYDPETEDPPGWLGNLPEAEE